MTTALTTAATGIAAIRDIRREALMQCRESEAAGDDFTRAIAVAHGIQAMREVFRKHPETIAAITQLAGTELGFRTDGDKEGGGTKYGASVVADCVIVALLNGLQLYGNMWNIISGRCYVTREGFSYLLGQYPGVTDLQVSVSMPEDPKAVGKQELCMLAASASCKLNGKTVRVQAMKDGDFDGRIAVKAFGGDVDALRGKATRRILKMLYERIIGSEISEPDDGVTVTVVEPEPAAQTITQDKFAPWRKEFTNAMEPVQDVVRSVKNAVESVDEDGIREALNTADELRKAGTINQRDYDRIGRFVDWAFQEVQS